MNQPCVYMMASDCRGTIYVGVTSDLRVRVWQHKNETPKGFTSEYDVKNLVWFKVFPDMRQAIEREKYVKNRRRFWKIRRIEEMNPEWRDLSADWDREERI